ncbi:MAG: hypothetical protein UZ17_ACD001001906 [Acidobacteria bacterium OLB17]|nr:MAG: hypothetical protein UZ17_ACD001001906 [Acidobacteria bacterium OLB17]MCZ2390210.1 hypothetical protein [Acidobacteriota bacterium]
MSSRRLELVFYLAGFLLAAAFAYFFTAGDQDWAFSTFILACSMFFLGYRFRLKGRIESRQAASGPAASTDEE